MTSTADGEDISELALDSVPDENAMNNHTAESKEPVSALQDNIERKGKNAYYFAHARKVRWY